MPVNVRRFVWLWLASIALAIVDISLFPPPTPSELNLGMTRLIQLEIFASVTAIWLAVQLPFFWLAVWRRKNWARWLLLAIFVAGTVYSLWFAFVPPKPPPGVDPFWHHMPPSGSLVGWLSLLAGAAAFCFLFAGDARSWFRGERSTDPPPA
jgi:hypothetical protein